MSQSLIAIASKCLVSLSLVLGPAMQVDAKSLDYLENEQLAIAFIKLNELMLPDDTLTKGFAYNQLHMSTTTLLFREQRKIELSFNKDKPAAASTAK